MRGISRRNFILGAGATTSGAFGMGLSSHSHGGNEKIRLGIIGTGARGQQHLKEGLWGNEDFEVVAVADWFRTNQYLGQECALACNAQIPMTPEGLHLEPEHKGRLRGATRATTYFTHQEMLAAEDLDAVVIATPPQTHAAMVLDCLRAGKHVFCEIPVATTIEDARNVVKRAYETGLVVQIGHQRRYHPNYNLAVKMCRETEFLARLTQVETCCHRNGPRRRPVDPAYQFDGIEKTFLRSDLEHHLNWRLYREISGSPFLDELPASIDTANWFVGAPPARIFAFGGLDYWKDGRTAPDNAVVTLEYRLDSKSETFVTIDGRNDQQDIHQINRSCSLYGTWSYNLANAGQGVFERILGDETTFRLDATGESTFKREAWAKPVFLEPDPYTPEEKEAIRRKFKAMLSKMTALERETYAISHHSSSVPPELERHPVSNGPIIAIGSEESAEVHQFRAFASHIRHGGTPRANVMVGLAAVIAGASARESLETGNPVDIDPTLMAFDFDTPSITGYDTGAAPVPGSMELL